MNKITIIQLLNKIVCNEEVPKKIKYKNIIWYFNKKDKTYYMNNTEIELFYIEKLTEKLNDEVEVLDEEDKDIPLIPDDDLYIINKKNGISEVNGTKYGTDKDTALNYNFKVLKEKINQVVEELNKRQ